MAHERAWLVAQARGLACVAGPGLEVSAFHLLRHLVDWSSGPLRKNTIYGRKSMVYGLLSWLVHAIHAIEQLHTFPAKIKQSKDVSDIVYALFVWFAMWSRWLNGHKLLWSQIRVERVIWLCFGCDLDNWTFSKILFMLDAIKRGI